MRLFPLLCTALLLAPAACTDDEDSPPEATPVATCDPGWQAAFDAWAEAGFSGSIAITSEGEPDCLLSYGLADREAGRPNTTDTTFSIGSISKAFTAAAVVDLADRGTFALTDRIGDLVPGLGGPVAGATVEQLLLHTSGLVGSHGTDHEPLGHDELLANLGALEQAAAPGEAYLYSNGGYSLLAALVEATSGTTYREHTVERILTLPGGTTIGGFWDGEPAAPEPRAVGYDGDGQPGHRGGFAGPHWAVDGNGDLAMTVAELAAWTHSLFTGELLSPAATEVVASPGFDHGGGRQETPGWVAFDDTLFGAPFLGAAGGGGDVFQDAVVVWVPSTGQTLAMASNAPDISAEALLQLVGPAIVTGEPLPLPEGGDDEGGSVALAAFAGTYELPSGDVLVVRVEDGGLLVVADGADAVATLRPLPADERAGAREHEARVAALLAGETRAGQEEVALLEDDLGPIRGVDVLGSVVDDGELRTYVHLDTADGTTTAWYAVDEGGGVEAVELTEHGPELRLRSIGAGSFVPDDPTGTGPDLEVTFAADGSTVTVSGPDGPATATRAR